MTRIGRIITDFLSYDPGLSGNWLRRARKLGCIAALYLHRTFSSPQAILNSTILDDGIANAAEPEIYTDETCQVLCNHPFKSVSSVKSVFQ